MPQFNFLSPLLRKIQKNGESTREQQPHYEHEFLVFGVPEDKYGHHTVLAYHEPKYGFRKVVASYGRMEDAIANAELLGEIRMRRPYAWDALERAAKPPSKIPRAGKEPVDVYITGLGCAGNSLYERLQERTKELRGEDVVPVAVYLARVTTNRPNLLFDGPIASLPEGYLMFYTR